MPWVMYDPTTERFRAYTFRGDWSKDLQDAELFRSAKNVEKARKAQLRGSYFQYWMNPEKWVDEETRRLGERTTAEYNSLVNTVAREVKLELI